MKTTYFVVLLFVLTSSAEEEEEVSLRACLQEDVCSAIVFNQIALGDIKNGMEDIAQNLTSEFQDNATNMEKLLQSLTSQFQDTANDVKKLMMILKPNNSGDNTGGELDRCLADNTDLKAQITNLEKKTQEIMLKDEATDEEKISLLQENEDLKKTQESLVAATSRLEEVVNLQKRQIANLTLVNYRPMDCADVMIKGQTQSGVYTIYPKRNEEESLEVLCDLESNGGGWTVFFTRQPQLQPIDFNESWENFKNGFGNISTEFWLGNDALHMLTSVGSTMLRIDAEDFRGDKRWAEWGIFNVDGESNKYQLTLEQYWRNSTMGDSLSMNSNSFFTTFDSDNDENRELNCAVGSHHFSKWGKGGWWFKDCGSTRPTAPLNNTNDWDSACWRFWTPKEEEELVSFKTLSMKMRRLDYGELAGLIQSL